MILIIAMIIVVIIIIALIIKYMYVQAHILSSKEFRKTAEKKSAKMRIKSPEITCDYCGCIINTAKEKKCPNCGAVYGDDKELKDRFKVDEAAVEKMAETAADKAISKAHKSGLETLKQIRIAIIALIGVFVLMIAYSVIVSRRTSTSNTKYRGNEELVDYSYMEYKLIDSPEVTILDQDGVTLRLMNVYASSLNEEGGYSNVCYRVAFSLISKRDKPVRLYLKCVGVNGRCKDNEYIYIYSNFKKKAEVLFYESVYGEYFQSIDEIVIGECSLSDEDGEIYKSNSMQTFKLNDKGYTVITNDKDMGEVIFENDEIRIRSLEKEDDKNHYELWIDNLSDSNYYIEASDLKVNGEYNDSYILHKSGIPAGYTLHHDSVFGLGDRYKNLPEDTKVELSLSFSDSVDPKKDFSTGYMTLK